VEWRGPGWWKTEQWAKRQHKRRGLQLTLERQNGDERQLEAARRTLRVMAYGAGQFPVTMGKHPTVSHRLYRDTAARECALVVPTPEPFTSKECCACRRIMKMDSKARTGFCSACAAGRPLRQAQALMDRDKNAAFGILFRFIRGLAMPLLHRLVAVRFKVPQHQEWVLRQLLG